MLTVVFTCMDVCDGRMFCTIFCGCCDVLCCTKKENFGVTVCNITGGWDGMGWKGRGFVNVKTGKDYKQKLKLHPGGREGMEVTFLRLVNFSWGLMGSGHADGSWGEGRLLSAPPPPHFFPPESPPSVSATEIWKGPNRFAGFFFLFLCVIS